MSTMSDLADAVANELNLGAFSPGFIACRLNDPDRELEELQTLRVDVIPGDKKCEAISRSVLQGDYRVEIAVRQKVAGGGDLDALADQLASLVEQIHQYFSLPPRRLQLYPLAAWKASELIYCYSIKALRGKRQFTSLLRLTYQVFEKAAA